VYIQGDSELGFIYKYIYIYVCVCVCVNSDLENKGLFIIKMINNIIIILE